MKEFFNKIKNQIKSKFIGNINYEREGIHPRRHWKTVLAATFCFLAWMSFMGLYMYFVISSGSFFDKEYTVEKSSTTINKKTLDRVVLDIKTKKDNLDELNKNSNVPPDPSL